MIEKDLTRIAVALETIAQALIWKNEFMEANFQTQPAKPNPVIQKAKEEIVEIYEKKLEEIKETPATHDTIGTVKTITTQFGSVTIPADEIKETPTPELKFEEVSKEFFALLNTIKASKGLDEAKQVATDLIRQYNNGKPISLATLPKESYVPLFEKITAAKAEYEPA